MGQSAVPQELPCFLLWDRAAKSNFVPHTRFFLASFPLLTTEFGFGWCCGLLRFTWKTTLSLLPFLPFLLATFRKKLHGVKGPEGHFFTKNPGELDICFKSSKEDTCCLTGRKITEGGLQLSAGDKHCWGSPVPLHHFCLNGPIYSCPKSSPFMSKLFSQALLVLRVILELLWVGPFSHVSYCQKKSLTVSWSFNVNNED